MSLIGAGAVCVAKAGITAEMDPGLQPVLVGVFKPGELLDISEEAHLSSGQLRLLTYRGWVSTVSGNGTVLFSPAAGASGVSSSPPPVPPAALNTCDPPSPAQPSLLS